MVEEIAHHDVELQAVADGAVEIAAGTGATTAVMTMTRTITAIAGVVGQEVVVQVELVVTVMAENRRRNFDLCL